MARGEAKKQSQSINQRAILTRSLVVIGVISLVFGLWAWWHFIYSNPKRVFYGMIDHALQTSSLGKLTSQDAQGQTASQRVVTETSPQQISSGQNNVHQIGDSSFDVVTEIAGTPKTDYIRYLTIKTSQPTSGGQSPNYKAILGVWGKANANSQQGGQLFNQTTLAIVPFGNLSYQQRHELKALIVKKKVYDVDFTSVKQTLVGGRPLYSYSVNVSPEAYITMLKQFAQFIGSNSLDQTNPADFHTAQSLKFQIDVDVWTREIRSVSYADGRQDNYDGFGAHIFAKEPTNAVGIEELQRRVQSSQ